MIRPTYLPVVLKNIVRRPARSVLTLSGIATAMFLFYAVQAMHQGVRQATRTSTNDLTLVVYRENRYCPFTSRLPEDYSRSIAALPGVQSVIPVKIVVNNCGTSLDVITFRGVPPEEFESMKGKDITLTAGSFAEWKRRGDAALVGQRFAQRRGLGLGDRVDLGGITVTVAGILSSPHPQDQNVAYVHLEFLQRAPGNAVGIVTQFNVKVTDPSQLATVAVAIDDLFRSDREPTTTWNEKAFTARAASDLIEIVSFARMLGWGALAAVFALVANAIILSVQERIKEHAVLQTLGFSTGLIARLIITEGVFLSVTGAAVGIAAAAAILKWGTFSLFVAGESVSIEAGSAVTLTGLLLCSLIGVLAGLFPAWQASRREITNCLRAV